MQQILEQVLEHIMGLQTCAVNVEQYPCPFPCTAYTQLDQLKREAEGLNQSPNQKVIK